MYRDHFPIESPGFKGLYAREYSMGAVTQEIPADHLMVATNILCKGKEIRTRPPLIRTNSTAFPGGKQLVRSRAYKRSDGLRHLLLFDDRTIYDDTNMAASIVTAPVGTTDFALTVINNNAYITYHNGDIGISGAAIDVYNGTSIRNAAGTAPTTALAAANGAAGKVEAGLHKLGFIFESDTGFFSQISPILDYTAPGGAKIDLSSVDTGPAGTVARHIVATKVMLANEEPSWFFVPGGEIADNATTTITVDFYDSELIDSADYLLDILPTIPCGVGIGQYNGRMIVWGEAANPNYVRVSEPNEPEVFQELDGFISTVPYEGTSGVLNCFVQRTLLYICKETRTEVTIDNDDAASTWDLHEVDSALGADVNSVGGIFESDENVAYDVTFIANKAGLWLFNGKFSETPLSWKIHSWWTSDDAAFTTWASRFQQLQVVVDTYRELIFVLVPHGDTSFHLLVASYEDGLEAESIKWHYWEFLGIGPVSITADSAGRSGAIYLACNLLATLIIGLYNFNWDTTVDLGRDKDSSGNVYNYTQIIRFPFAGLETSQQHHFNAIQTRLFGVGSFSVIAHDLNETTTTLGTITLGTTARSRTLDFPNGGIDTEKLSIRFQSESGVLTRFKMNSAILYAKPSDEEYPESLK